MTNFDLSKVLAANLELATYINGMINAYLVDDVNLDGGEVITILKSGTFTDTNNAQMGTISTRPTTGILIAIKNTSIIIAGYANDDNLEYLKSYAQSVGMGATWHNNAFYSKLDNPSSNTDLLNSLKNYSAGYAAHKSSVESTKTNKINAIRTAWTF